MQSQHHITMKSLTIGDTVYNLAYLISVKYKAKTKEAAPRRAKSPDAESSGTPAEALKSNSSLGLHFLDCKPLTLKNEKADAVWAKLSALLDLDPETP